MIEHHDLNLDAYLSAHALFKAIPYDMYAAIRELGSFEVFRQGEPVFPPRSDIDRLLFVVTGRVTYTKAGHVVDRGPGEVFGLWTDEYALSENGAEAAEDSTLISLDRDVVTYLCQSDMNLVNLFVMEGTLRKSHALSLPDVQRTRLLEVMAHTVAIDEDIDKREHNFLTHMAGFLDIPLNTLDLSMGSIQHSLRLIQVFRELTRADGEYGLCEFVFGLVNLVASLDDQISKAEVAMLNELRMHLAGAAERFCITVEIATGDEAGAVPDLPFVLREEAAIRISDLRSQAMAYYLASRFEKLGQTVKVEEDVAA
ncbi:Crp/Fnr family transcriptional regulator [Roseovarius indicus]|uniref:Cyclic nucleotide-binding domain-containing protein n=1 Tax=Roseovarius indicus TaxID=540747 RepID=A0A0T5PE76_9RHOB|nr:Crp/Fnr family transcriptional regulator [Roseovarius indicus]KRS19214.1 hypothetical protein XM52_06060 [Roseovarius indicus]QEW25817.1 hypothetical protein RIdsm_01606 [Roseovarius indicus]SFD88835.1 hypothetical protein SAMN04488031_10320 [Roseovarius indicus]